ncbi:MAG: hypothetical protein ACREGR_04965 [Minisyncoccia bacterium]
MGDVMRELVGDPYADLYDCDSYPSYLAGAVSGLQDMLTHKEAGTVPDYLAPWSDLDTEIAAAEKQIAELEAKIACGILHPVQERAMVLEGGW